MDDPNLGADTPVNRGNAGKGRPKGSVNKSTAQIKAAILDALDSAGDTVGEAHYGGLRGGQAWLHHLALGNSSAFATLLGKILPIQLTGDDEAPINVIHKIERVIVDVKD